MPRPPATLRGAAPAAPAGEARPPRAPRPRRPAARRLAILLLATLASCGGGPPPPAVSTRPRPTARPPVVLVDVSGARYDAVVPRAGTPTLLPAFAAFQGRATWFAQAASAAPWETPSLATALTGLIPFDTNVRGRAGVDRPYLIPPITTLAETLRDEGYATAAFATGPRVTRPTGLDQGFDLWREGLALDGAAGEASDWLRAHGAERPFLLFVHLDATRPPPPEGEKDLASWAGPAYERRVLEADTALARLLAAVEGAALPADAMTILFSDHGEPRAIPPSGALRGDDVTEDAIHVPLAIRAAALPAGRVEGSCGLVDLLPTVREAMGLPPAGGLDGRSLAPLARAPQAPGAPVMVQAWRRATTPAGPRDESVYGVRTGRAKFVAVFTARPAAWTEALYDLETDPEERTPLPGSAAGRFGPDFTRAVQAVRDVLDGRRKHLQDPVVSGYVAGGG